MKEQIKVAVIPPNEAPYMKVIPNTLEAFQGLVNGYIEAVPLKYGVYMILNEEGKFDEAYNCDYFDDELCGNIVLCGVDEEDFDDCPQIALDMLNVINVGYRFGQLHNIDPMEPYRASAVKLALEGLSGGASCEGRMYFS